MLKQIVAGRLAARPELGHIYRELNRALGELERALGHAADSRSSRLTENVSRLLCSGGKRLRPALAWLSYGAGGGGTLPILPLMTMLELMHTASLIHDDVVDGASERRGVATIHRTLDEGRAVQCGDFLLSRAMEHLHIYRGTGINETLSHTSREMCLGELAQMAAAGRLAGRREADYFLQIRRKTAYLLSASCYTGAIAGGMEEGEAAAFRDYGLHLGMAFQLKDDLLDFCPGSAFGKAAGQDLKRGIFTLPVLHALSSNPNPAMEALLEKPDKCAGELRALMDYIAVSGGLGYTQQVLEQASRDATAALEGAADTPQRDALMELASTLATRQV